MRSKVQLGALLFFLSLSLVFSLDCFTPLAADSQTMECCGSMPCNQGNSQHDCCKSMQQSPVAMLAAASGSLLIAPASARDFGLHLVFLFPPTAPTLQVAFTGSPGKFDAAGPPDSSPPIAVLRI